MLRIYIAAPDKTVRNEMLEKAKQTLGSDIVTVDLTYSVDEKAAPIYCRAPKLWELTKALEQLSTADVIVVRQEYHYQPCTEIPMLCAKRFNIQILMV